MGLLEDCTFSDTRVINMHKKPYIHMYHKPKLRYEIRNPVILGTTNSWLKLGGKYESIIDTIDECYIHLY